MPQPPEISLAIAKALGSALAATSLAAAQALYLFTPLLVSAALAAVVMRRGWLAFLDRPIDHGAMLRGERWFGDGKTWRGLVLSVTGSSLALLVQQALAERVPRELCVIDYAHVNALALGAALGMGAVLGELPNSFVKRRLRIPRGATAAGPLGVLFYVWDQVDTVLGAWPLLWLWMRPTALLVVLSLAVALAVHPLVAWIGYRLGARATPR